MQDLHFKAVHALGMLNMCQSFNDEWGVKFYSRQYDKTIQRLAALPKLEQPTPLTDADTEYILNNGPKPEFNPTPMKVTENGFHFFTPENEQ